MPAYSKKSIASNMDIALAAIVHRLALQTLYDSAGKLRTDLPEVQKWNDGMNGWFADLRLPNTANRLKRFFGRHGENAYFNLLPIVVAMTEDT